jgi:hypothetical protein
MSLRLLQAVLASNHTQSSTRLAQVVLAWHACSWCERIYVSVDRLAHELNHAPRKTKRLLQKLRHEKVIEPTGETTEYGVPVYRLVGVTRESPGGDPKGTWGVTKRCQFCREGVTQKAPNKQGIDKRTINQRSKKCGRDGCDQPQCPHGQQCAEHACCEACAAAG